MNPAALVPLIVGVPLSAAAILVGAGKSLPRRLADSIAILSTVISIGCGCWIFNHVIEQPIVYWFGGWYPRKGVAIGISFYADPVSVSLCVLTAVLTCTAFVYSWHYFESAGTHYHALMLVLSGAICGFLLTADLFNMFVFFELSTVSAVALCGYHSESPGPLQGAWNFGVICTVAAVTALTGVALLYGRTGALNFAQVGAGIAHDPNPLVLVALAFIACGLMVKGGFAPFHFWLADAHAVAATPACVMFSGIMVEMTAVVVLRLYFVLFSTAVGDREWTVRALLLGFSSVTAVLGAIMCLLQTHLKRLLAYSTISHVGLVLLAGAMLVPEAIGCAMLYIIAHGFVKGSLFLCTGALKQRFNAIDESELHGRARGWYLLLAIYTLGAIGLAAAPLFLTGRADSLVEAAVRDHGLHWTVWIFSFSAIITAGAVLRSAGAVFFGWGPREASSSKESGGEREAAAGGRKVERIMLLPAALLIALAIGLSFTPGLDHIVLRAATDFHDGTRIRDRIMNITHAPLKQADAHREKELMAEPVAEKYSVEKGLINVALALAVAFLALNRDRLRLTRVRILTRPASLLRAIHTGTVGDYAAWFIAGVAVFSGVMLLLWRM
ncbi:MAG TPA: proton-conducting transporter membrane subunit [Terriglobia bacterium]|nr:proton-conducting transporter membrane subunit [Terriglobia bacterium]